MSLWRTLDSRPTRIIAHRGASGLRPEHTLAGYRLAIEQGADLIEPDLVPSRDGVLFARHENALSRSTDARSRPDWGDAAQRALDPTRRWQAEEYDAEQLASLRAVQPFAGRSAAFDGQFGIPLFSDILDLAEAEWKAGRALGVYPEIKHPSELLAKGLDSTALLISQLRARSLVGSDCPVWVQCFERAPLRRVHQALGNPTFALFEQLDDKALAALWSEAPWLNGVALSKALLIGHRAHADLVARVHDLGWQVHVWTLRDDAVMVGFDDVHAEYRALFELGVDAMFCDFPMSAVSARQLRLQMPI